MAGWCWLVPGFNRKGRKERNGSLEFESCLDSRANQLFALFAYVAVKPPGGPRSKAFQPNGTG